MTTRPSSRFVSRLTRNTLALVLSGGRGTRLQMLTDWRAKPAVPFGGKFRIIDFALSNCLNSGIRRISILTQYKSHSLIRHIMEGWNHLRSEYGEFVELVPAQQWLEEDSWYAGTADAVYQSLDIIASHDPEYVLILAGDHVYKMDYGEMLAAHVDAGAYLTIACKPVPIAEAKSFGVMAVDEDKRIREFLEKPESPRSLPDDPEHALASMGIYIFSRDFLMDALQADADDSNSSHDFGKDIIPRAIEIDHHVLAFPLTGNDHEGGYWRDVGTVDSYYQSNMELSASKPALDLHDINWPIWTYQPQLPSAKFVQEPGTAPGRVSSSMISGGCVVNASDIVNSILFSNVQVAAGCELEGVLALPDCSIGANCRLQGVILDNGCVVPEGTVIGEDRAADEARFYITEGGIVVANRTMFGQEREYRPTMAAPRGG